MTSVPVHRGSGPIFTYLPYPPNFPNHPNLFYYTQKTEAANPDKNKSGPRLESLKNRLEQTTGIRHKGVMAVTTVIN